MGMTLLCSTTILTTRLLLFIGHYPHLYDTILRMTAMQKSNINTNESNPRNQQD